MSLAEEVELLRNIPLFAKIEPAKLKLLAFTSERMTFQAGDTVVRQGDAGDAAYIIVSGSADITVQTDGTELKVAEVGRNDIIGEIAILCDVPRTATVTATGELVTLKISKELFFRMIKEFPEISIQVMRELAERLDRTTGQLREALSRNG